MTPTEPTARRNITLPPSLWTQVVQAAARETAKTGVQVSASAWIRDAIRERLDQQDARRDPWT